MIEIPLEVGPAVRYDGAVGRRERGVQCVGHTEADQVRATVRYVRFGTIDERSGAENDGLIVGREHLGRRFRNGADALVMLNLFIDGSDFSRLFDPSFRNCAPAPCEGRC